MDDWRIDAEIAWVRIRGWLHVSLRVIGLGLVCLAIWNLLGPAVSEYGAIAPYREPISVGLGLTQGSRYVADLLVLGIGLVVAWWG